MNQDREHCRHVVTTHLACAARLGPFGGVVGAIVAGAFSLRRPMRATRSGTIVTVPFIAWAMFIAMSIVFTRGHSILRMMVSIGTMESSIRRSPHEVGASSRSLGHLVRAMGRVAVVTTIVTVPGTPVTVEVGMLETPMWWFE